MTYLTSSIMKKLLFGLFLLFGSTTTLFAQDTPQLKKRIAILTFEDKTSQPQSYNFVGKDAGDGFSEMLTTALVKTDNYIVIERSQLAELLNEQSLSEAGIATPESAAQAGKVIGAELVVFGAVTEFGYSQQSSSGNTRKLKLGVDNSKATVAVDVRIVDPETSEIIAAEDIRKERSKKGLNLRVKDLELGSQNEFDESIVGKATRDAINGVVDLLEKNSDKIRWQAKVITMNGGDVFINAGSKVGVKAGHTFNIYRPGEELIDPDTGLNLGSVESKVGVVEVIDSEVGEGKAARCKVVEGEGFQRDDLVRVD